MRRRVALWIAQVHFRRKRQATELSLMQSAIAGAAGSLAGLAVALIIIRPLLYACGFEGVWR